LSQTCRTCRKLLLMLSWIAFVFLTFQNCYLFCDNFCDNFCDKFRSLFLRLGSALCRLFRMAFARV
jgi:ABC-type multidrug transport system permease subunit